MNDELPLADLEALESLLARAPDHAVVIGRDHRVRWANQTTLRWIGRPILGEALESFAPEETRALVTDALEHVFTTGEGASFDLQAVGPIGPRWFSTRLGPVVRDGRAERVLLIGSDITERIDERQTIAHEREALRQSEQRFRTLVDYAPDAMVIFDLDSGRFVDVNDNACRLYEIPRDQLLERGPVDLSPELQPDGTPSRTAALRYLERALAGETPTFEWLHCTGAGKPVPCEIRLVRMPHPERRLVRGSMTDISERKRADEERHRLTAALAQAQKLQALGQLTGGVAHDFNNLLTVVMSCLDLIALDAPWPDLVRAHAEDAMDAARRGAALTQRLLAFARRQPLRPQTVDPNRLVTGLEGLLRRTLGETITIETRLAPDIWPCQADPAQLENALLNLAINARDAMPEGGRLTITTSNTPLEHAPHPRDVPSGHHVLLAIADDGVGMNEAVLGQAFEPFFTTKEIGRGSGLGLSMVYGFVKQSGGHVDIESAPGEGTTVRLYLPRSLSSSHEVHRSPPASANARGSGRLVLVVEDELTVRTLVVTLLERLGYRTAQAGDADTALGLLRDQPAISLLLSDVVLPGGMNGTELARRASALNPALPIMLMSGYADDAIIREGRLHPDITLLRKPFTQAELAAALEDTFNAQRGEST